MSRVEGNYEDQCMTIEEVRDRVEFAKDHHMQVHTECGDRTSYWYRTGYIDACKDILRYLDECIDNKET